MLKRTLTLIAAVALLGAACSSSNENADAVEAAEATQSALVEAFLSGDVDASAAMYADEVEFYDPMIGTTSTGLAAMRTQAQTVFPWTDLEQTELLDRFVSSDGTSGFLVYRWVGERGFSSFDLTMVQVHEYRDGLLHKLTNYYGNSDAAAQLGI